MSPLSLLILASLIAALAFFLAGLLLAPARARHAAGLPEPPAPPTDETMRRDQAASEQALTDARARLAVETAARERAEAERLDAERRHDDLRAQLAQRAAHEKTLAERLRVAEEANRAAFKREEEAAEMWAGQLEAARVEHKRHDQALDHEVAELRAKLGAGAAERERLAAETAKERERLAQATKDATLREQGALARLVAAESAAQNQLAEARARHQAEQTAAAEERETLALRVRAAEEVAEQRREEAVAAVEARRGAEAKLKAAERLAQENATLRAQQAEAEHAAQARAELAAETKDAKVELAAAQAKLAELERVVEENRRLRDQVTELGSHQEASAELERLQAANKQARLDAELMARRLRELEHTAEENRGLRDDIAELRTHEAASVELERLQAAHKQVRLDAELMARRLQELLHERSELLPLRAQAAEAAALAQEVEYLRRRERDLEAQIYAGGSFASRELPMLSGEIPMASPGTDLETHLDVLVSKGGPRTAVLADAQGFLIASAGESVTQEGLAAFAAVAGEMVARARMLLPLADVQSVRVTDANRMVLSCHLFTSAGEDLGVATLGPGEPPPAETAHAIAGLAAIVNGHAEGPGAEAAEPVQPGNVEPAPDEPA